MLLKVNLVKIDSHWSDQKKLFLMWEIIHGMIEKSLVTIVTSDIDNKIEAKKHFLECVIHSCEGAIKHRLQEGIDDRSNPTQS